MPRAEGKQALPAALFQSALDHVVEHIKDRAMFLRRRSFHLCRKGRWKDKRRVVDRGFHPFTLRPNRTVFQHDLGLPEVAGSKVPV